MQALKTLRCLSVFAETVWFRSQRLVTKEATTTIVNPTAVVRTAAYPDAVMV
jgi:hypothetical protein